MGYAQLVIGPAGSGKVIDSYFFLFVLLHWAYHFPVIFGFFCGVLLFILWFLNHVTNFFIYCYQSTYCSSLYRHCETVGRTVHIVNLDPAAENFDYPVAMGK